MSIGIYKRNPEQGRKHSEWMKKHPVKYWLGKKRSQVDKDKFRLAKLGKRDEKTNRWLGDDVGYDGLHDWVKKKLGQPDTCEGCGKKGLAGQRIHWANKSGEYKRDVKDWIRLCVKCHSKYDHARV